LLSRFVGILNLTGVLRLGVREWDIEGERIGVPGTGVAPLEEDGLLDFCSAVGCTSDQPKSAVRMAVSEGGSALICCPTASSELAGILYEDTIELMEFTWA
jgi:hypothetical protein